MLRKLIEFLPISRRRYMETIENIMIVLDGLIEAEANHCQIEMSLIQQSQTKKMKKPETKKSTINGKDPAFQ